VLPREVAASVMATAVARGARAGAILILASHAALLIDRFVRRGIAAQLPLPLGVIVVLAIVIALTDLSALRRWFPALFLVAFVLAVVAESNILIADPATRESATYLVNRPAMVLALMAPPVTRAVIGAAWSSIGFVLGVASLYVSAGVAGVSVVTGTGPVITVVICVGTYVTLALVRYSQRQQMPDLEKLQADTRRAALDHEYEQRAAALVHDTVLNDLTVVMMSSGVLDDRARARLVSDVATLSNGAWLGESQRPTVDDADDAALRNGMVALVSESQWRGLTVDVTGNPVDEVVSLSAERIAALHGAVRACLDNVIQHAETGAAELVLGVDEDSVTVMVIDQGIGFDPGAVPSDRLGLRSSVFGRVESVGGNVRVWSKPGKGTSVMISIPATVTLQKAGERRGR
jgi:signal transduction histidine kinase